MKLSLVLIVAAALLATSTAATVLTNCPGGIQERREWRTLTKAQQETYLRAVQAIKDNGTHDRLTMMHYSNSQNIHNVAAFLPWHRAFIREYEISLQAIDSTISLAYWQEDIDSQAPEKAPIFASDAFGGNGQTSKHCVKDGVTAKWSFPQIGSPGPASSPFAPQTCLRRQFTSNNGGTTFGALFSPEYVNSVIARAGDFAAYNKGMANVHDRGHSNINGDMGLLGSAARDPVFFLHHAYIDKLWSIWQKRQASFMTSYSGTNGDGSAAKLTDALPAYSNYIVSDVEDTRSLCYTYRPFSITDVPGYVPPPTTSADSATSAAPTSTAVPTTSTATVNGTTAVITTVPTPTGGAESSATTSPTDPITVIIIPSGSSTEITVTPTGTASATVSAAISASATVSASVTSSGPQPTSGAGNSGDYTPPDSTDRQDITGLRDPGPIDDQFYVNNHMNVTEKHEAQKEVTEIYKLLNSIPGYTSPAALINQPGLLDALTTLGKDLVARYPGIGKIIIPVTKDSSKGSADRIKNYLLTNAPSVLTPPKDVSQKLESAVGAYVLDKDASNNFYKQDGAAESDDEDCSDDDEDYEDEEDCSEDEDDEDCSEDESDYEDEEDCSADEDEDYSEDEEDAADQYVEA